MRKTFSVAAPRSIFIAMLVFAFAPAASAQTPALTPALVPLTFLIGTWRSGSGSVADSGQTSHGSSVITSEAGGAVLLRRDHTDLFATDGKPSGSFEQIMMIYPDAGDIRADYSDGTHVIHYTSAAVVEQRSVVFTTAIQPSAPAFRLTYTKKGVDGLDVRFEIEPPGQSTFHVIAAGTLLR